MDSLAMNRFAARGAIAAIAFLSAGCGLPALQYRYLVTEATRPAAEIRSAVRPIRVQTQDLRATAPLRIVLWIQAPKDSALWLALGDAVPDTSLESFRRSQLDAIRSQVRTMTESRELLPQRVMAPGILPSVVTVLDDRDQVVATTEIRPIPKDAQGICLWDQTTPTSVFYVAPGQATQVCMEAVVEQGRARDRTRYTIQARWIAVRATAAQCRPGRAVECILQVSPEIRPFNLRERDPLVPTIHTITGESRVFRIRYWTAVGVGMTAILAIVGASLGST